MQVQFGRTLGTVLMTFGLFLLVLQLWLRSRTYNPPPSARKENTRMLGSADPWPARLPGILGGLFLVGGIIIFSANLRRPDDAPVRPGPKV